MRKIGIVTYWYSEDNYGQILQCYALQKFLKQLGHAPFLIRDKREKKSVFIRIIIFLFLLFSLQFQIIWNRLYSIVVHILSRRRNKKHPRYFDDFRSNHITSTKKQYTISELKKKSAICGCLHLWK
jgi:hypothetical protein